MKKTLTLLLAVVIAVPVFSQDSPNDKKFRFGLKMTPSFNWLKVDDTKTFDPNGVAMKFGYGLMTEFHLAGAAWFSTGFQVDYDGGKIATTATDPFIDNSSGKMFYSYDANKGLAPFDDTALNGYKTYWLRERKYRSTYLTLPIQLRLKTKEIGFMTYFGNIGVNASFHMKTLVNDQVNQMNSGSGVGYNTSQEEIADLKINDDMNIIRLGLVIGGGAEWNLSGSTSMLFGLHFFQGFTNTVQKDSEYIVDGEQTTLAAGAPVAQRQKFLNRNISITIGILF